MKTETTPIAGVLVASTNVIGDARGNFMRCFEEGLGVEGEIKQINFSRTAAKGTVRGMHFQTKPALETKMVRCVKGAIYDVALDLRQNSPTFLQHFAVELSAENNLMLIIPPGCAHGFQALTDDVEMLYLHTAGYTPAAEGGVKIDDAKLNIKWPLAPHSLSARDVGFAELTDDFKGIEI